MSMHRWRVWLPIVSALLLAGSLAVLGWAILAPCRVSVSTATHAAVRPKAADPPEANKAIAWDTFAPVGDRRFQLPLYDPPPKAAPPPAEKVVAPPRFTLVATMPESGGGNAAFTDPTGAFVIKTLGSELVDGESRAELTEIANDHVVLRQGERRITLKLTRE